MNWKVTLTLLDDSTEEHKFHGNEIAMYLFIDDLDLDSVMSFTVSRY